MVIGRVLIQQRRRSFYEEYIMAAKKWDRIRPLTERELLLEAQKGLEGFLPGENDDNCDETESGSRQKPLVHLSLNLSRQLAVTLIQNMTYHLQSILRMKIRCQIIRKKIKMQHRIL
ncbi:uncharacterized protein LOC115874331 [Sitophilus oryzae]|uniref:Uncharacterized protein LOC115874331 n=1 Tax=Sitophilus oryzae TaxID=7048 RepID=A0A6J2X289_SITOR|nr:uncharacterized protein LOC115874331 [Sitophilus oryzae]